MNYTRFRKDLDAHLEREKEQNENVAYQEAMKEIGIDVMHTEPKGGAA